MARHVSGIWLTVVTVQPSIAAISDASINTRLGELTGGVQYQSHVDPAAILAEKADLEDFAGSMRRNYRLLVNEAPERDLSCKVVAASISAADAVAYSLSGDPAKPVLAKLATVCRGIAEKDEAINSSPMLAA